VYNENSGKIYKNRFENPIFNIKSVYDEIIQKKIDINFIGDFKISFSVGFLVLPLIEQQEVDMVEKSSKLSNIFLRYKIKLLEDEVQNLHQKSKK